MTEKIIFKFRHILNYRIQPKIIRFTPNSYYIVNNSYNTILYSVDIAIIYKA